AGFYRQRRSWDEHRKRWKAKMPHAILLHGYFNGRLHPGEQRRFTYEELARFLRRRPRHKSTLKARLAGPLRKLEEAGAIKIQEPKEPPSSRRKQDFVTVSLALEEDGAKPPRPLEPHAFSLFDK